MAKKQTPLRDSFFTDIYQRAIRKRDAIRFVEGFEVYAADADAEFY